jgi:hypothetical protein
MQTLIVISDNEYLLNMWYDVFKIASDANDIERYLLSEFNHSFLEGKKVDSLVIIGGDLKLDELSDLVLQVKMLGIPIIVSKNMADRSVANLLNLGVRSVVNIDMSILTISNTLRIVESGGVYINPLEIKRGFYNNFIIVVTLLFTNT